MRKNALIFDQNKSKIVEISCPSAICDPKQGISQENLPPLPGGQVGGWSRSNPGVLPGPSLGGSSELKETRWKFCGMSAGRRRGTDGLGVSTLGQVEIAQRRLRRLQWPAGTDSTNSLTLEVAHLESRGAESRAADRRGRPAGCPRYPARKALGGAGGRGRRRPCEPSPHRNHGGRATPASCKPRNGRTCATVVGCASSRGLTRRAVRDVSSTCDGHAES